MGRASRHGKAVKKSHVGAVADGARAILPDGPAKRVFRIPRRNESRYSLRDGSIGSRLSLQEVFNRAHAEVEGCSYMDDEPLSQADVYGINRDIRCQLYDIKRLKKGEQTFMQLMKQHPIFLNELRGTIEKKWDVLQRCKAQWGVDWAIQRVLQRDRLYKKMIRTGSLLSRSARKSQVSRSEQASPSGSDDKSHEGSDQGEQDNLDSAESSHSKNRDEGNEEDDEDESVESQDDERRNMKPVKAFASRGLTRKTTNLVVLKTDERRSVRKSAKHSSIRQKGDSLISKGSPESKERANQTQSEPKTTPSPRSQLFQRGKTTRKRTRIHIESDSEHASVLNPPQSRRSKKGRVGKKNNSCTRTPKK